MSVFRILLIPVFAAIFVVEVQGQATRSPFTTFGIGELYSNSLANNQGMGGTGVSQPQFLHANHANPALLVHNGYTVFHAGVVGEQRRIRTDTVNEVTRGGNLNYLLMGFRIMANKQGRSQWSSAVSLTPFSTVNFNIHYNDSIQGTNDLAAVTEKGEGGLTALNWANGFRLPANFSVGFKATYLFGSIVNRYENKLIDSDVPLNYSVVVEEKSYLKDFVFQAGLSYSVDSLLNRNRYRFSAGLVYDFGSNVKGTRRDTFYRTSGLGDVIDPDTLALRSGHITLPQGITAGLSLSQGSGGITPWGDRFPRWSLSAEYSHRDWSTFRSINDDDEGLKEAWRFSFGGEITPSVFSENYFSRVTYRLGMSTEEYPILANGKRVKDTGINFGFSLPTGGSSIDLGFRFGRRGNRTENLISEDYFRVFFGITFNDAEWFIKRRFD